MKMIHSATTLIPGNDCQDTNECQVNNGGCQHFCNNTDGSFSCSCRAGYNVASYEPTFCADINECDMENGGCSHDCINSEGNYICQCPEGYQLRSDNKNCKLVQKGMPCSSHSRPEHG